MEKIDSEVNPKIINTFVFENPNYDLNEDLIISSINQRFPSLLLNMDKKPEKTKYSKLFENPRKYSCLIIILRNSFEKSYTRKVQEVMKFMNSSAPTPRLLAISVDEDAWNTTKFKKILLYGWKEKYLDFTIIGKPKGNNLKIMQYNPFTATFLAETYNSATILFPDKLNNMNGYPIKIPLINYPPYIEYTVSNIKPDSSLIKVKSWQHNILKTICEKLNCTLDPDPVGSWDELVGKRIFSALEKNIYNLFAVGSYRNRYIYNKKLLWGMHFEYEKLVFLAPKIAVSEFSIPNIFWPLFCAAVFVISFFFLAKVLKFPKRYWNLMSLYEVLLGHKIRLLTFSFLQKSIYIIIVFSAIGITVEFLTPTKIQIINKGSLDSLEKIAISNIPIFGTSKLYLDWYIQKINKTEMNYTLHNRLPILKSPINRCVEDLLKLENAICITSNLPGDYYAKKYQDKDEKSMLEMIDLDIFGDFLSFPYESRSPFIEKFDIVMRRIIESGTRKYWENFNYESRSSDSESLFAKIKDQLTLQRFIIILIFGYFISTLVFFSEIFSCKYLKKKFNWHN